MNGPGLSKAGLDKPVEVMELEEALQVKRITRVDS
jgi:hypothetical protein